MSKFRKWNGFGKVFNLLFFGILSLALILGMTACGGGESSPPCEEVVDFPDRNLEEAIREAIDKPKGDICKEELEVLTKKPGDRTYGVVNVSDLSGLEHCTSLTELTIFFDKSSVIDLSPISRLPNLKKLILKYGLINDISPLAKLTNLRELWINEIQIRDISPISNLTSLEHLDLSHNQISDISPIANITTLENLKLSYNQISDISPLSNLPNLTFFVIQANQISDIYPLVENDGLDEHTSLYLQDNPLNEQSVNEHIPQLKGRGIEVFW